MFDRKFLVTTRSSALSSRMRSWRRRDWSTSSRQLSPFGICCRSSQTRLVTPGSRVLPRIHESVPNIERCLESWQHAFKLVRVFYILCPKPCCCFVLLLFSNASMKIWLLKELRWIRSKMQIRGCGFKSQSQQKLISVACLLSKFTWPIFGKKSTDYTKSRIRTLKTISLFFLRMLINHLCG